MFTAFALALLVLVLAALAYAATRPDTFQIARTARIAAAPETIFPHINDLRAFNVWNPFIKHDPNIALAYSGPASGVGARHDWDGNRNVGKGSVEITGSRAPSEVRMKLDMLKPLEAHNTVVFTLAPRGPETDVTWTMHGQSTFVSKLMCLVMSPDKMVGGTFEKGLADLKVLTEGMAGARH